jgi:hypothetical protein
MTGARSRRSGAWVAPIMLAGWGLFWFADTVADPDLWGHVRFGRDILRAGAIVRSDPYSYRTNGQTWINHEWLAEVIFAGLYDQAGPTGLIAWKVLVSLLIVGLGYGHLRRSGLGPFRSLLLLIVISVPFRMGLGTIRPQLFTYLGFLILLLLIQRSATGHESRAWAVPILFAVWVNLHGGVLAGVGVLGLWLVARLVEGFRTDGEPPIWRLGVIVRVVLLGLASGLALTLNPYGPGLVSFLLRTATGPRPEIREWAPLTLLSLPGLIVLGLLGLGIMGLVASRRRREPSAVLIFVATAVEAVAANRHYPLFALALVVMLGEHLADAWERGWPPRADRGHGWSAVGLVGGLLLIGLAVPRFGCIRIEPFYFAFPARAVAWLKAGGVRGNMAVPFDWGEYVIGQLGTAVKVSIDGRRETVYSDESYRQAQDFERGTGAWDALLKTATTDLVLTKSGSPTANLMSRTAGWLPLYQDTCAVIFVRAGRPDLDRLVATPVPALPDNGDGLCFPVTRRGRRD